MTKLQVRDLTPEVLEEVAKLENAEAVKAYFAGKDIEVSDKIAGLIVEHVKEGKLELTDETLDAVSGGCGGKKGTVS